MICSSCGTENEATRKFCGECGARLSTSCPACGTPNPPGTKFCGECGASTQAAPRATGREPAAVHVQPVAERRLVSVLFADLVGFTTLSESRDAEEVRELLTRYFDTCRQLVDRYGGMVEKFIGDAVMAVWGTPTTNEDDAERAVRAALDLTAAVRSMGDEVGIPALRARAGVLSGEAAVTIGATGQGMVAGDLVNTASRIQAAAPPGSVLVGAETKLATDSAIEYEDAGLHELKGKAAGVPLWRAVRVVGLTGGTGRSQEIEPPFTGRDPELRLMKQLFHSTADERRAHLVSVMGIGGIGKSRLVWELEKYVDGLAQEVWWQRGRCLAYGDGVAFWALGEMVRTRAGIVEDEDGESALRKLRAALDRFVPDAEERRFAEPRLAQLLGLEPAGAGDQENLFSAWRLFFERVADTAPSVMVFEDLHWADDSLVDFIEYVLDWGRERPIFIVTLARPELLERRPTWGAAKRSLTSLLLEPLTSDQIDLLLQGAVTGLPDELRGRILERAEGIPFYAVETVRMLLDRGLLVREGSGYRATGTIETLEVPTTLHALIAARLDGLPVDERRVLQDASVVGRTFSVPGLAAVSGLPEEDLVPLLDALVRKEILSLGRDPLSPERGQYGFLQDLVKRVAYETMSKRDRRPRHLAAAAYLSSTAGSEDDVVEVIAAHYLEAHRAAPDADDAQEVGLLARDALIRAGERAASLGANLGAQRHFERAAELTEDPIVRGELLERAGIMASAGSRPDDAAALYRQAGQLFEESGATHPAARVSARNAEIMWDLGRFGAELERMDRSFEVLAQEKPDADLAALAAQVGRFAFFAGDLDLAGRRLETALAAAEALGLPEVLSQALNTKGLLLSASGRRREGLAMLRYALDVALEHDKPSAALRAYNNLAELALQDDQYATAERYVSEGLQLARRVGNRYWEQILLGQGIGPLYALGEWDLARERMRELDEVGGPTRARTAYTQGYVTFGVAIRVARGEMEAARRLLETWEDLASSADRQERMEHAAATALWHLAEDPAAAFPIAMEALELRATFGWDDSRLKEAFVAAVEAAIRIGDLSSAEGLLAELRSRPPGLVTHFGLAQSMRLEAVLDLKRGGSGPSEDGWKGAIGLFRELALPYWTARSLLEQGAWLRAGGRRAEAEGSLDEARDIFNRLGAAAWSVRVEAVRNGADPDSPGSADAQAATQASSR